jgi:hypothetical protein
MRDRAHPATGLRGRLSVQVAIRHVAYAALPELMEAKKSLRV